MPYMDHRDQEKRAMGEAKDGTARGMRMMKERVMAKERRMTRTISTATLLLAWGGALPVPGMAQTLSQEDPVLRQIWEEAQERSQIPTLSQSLLDSIGPRLTGSPQSERAQAWAVGLLESWGYEAEVEEYGTWEGWDRGPSHVDLVSPRVRSLEGRILAWSPGTGGRPVEGGVTFPQDIGSPADWDRFLGTVEGRWVMMSFPEPTCRTDDQWEQFAQQGSFERMDRERDAARDDWNENLQAAGSDDPRLRDLHRQLESAGALGIISSTWTGAFGTTRVFNSYTRGVPTFELSCEDYGLVHRLAENGQDPVVRLTAEAENLGEVPVGNVIARLEGSENPDEYVILSAHYDSWDGGSGATDNGTGSVLMLEAARILATVNPNPKRTILVALWNGEEQGLNGSRAFVEDNPDVVEGLQALFNQDNGTGRVVSMSASGFTEASGRLAGWLARVPAEVTSYIDESFPGTPSSGGTDHASFVCAPAPGFSLGALNWGYFDHTWHTHRDTFDKLVFDDLRNNAVLVASLAYLAAEDDERMSRERRDVFPVNRSTGQQGSWPECQPATRSSGESPRME